MLKQKRSFHELIDEALAQNFSGWDFSWTRGRWEEGEPPWDYRALIVARLPHIGSLLDMGTGGGEFLASLAPLPPTAVATEAYPPNVPIARQRLGPLGVELVEVEEDGILPLPDRAFDLVINRHEFYDAAEVARVLRPGGQFVTQQVGPDDAMALNEFLGAPTDVYDDGFVWPDEIRAAEAAGLQVVRREEAFMPSTFFDVGAIVFYLKAIPWQVPDFSIERYYDRLLALHEHIEREGHFTMRAQRYLLVAHKPKDGQGSR